MSRITKLFDVRLKVDEVDGIKDDALAFISFPWWGREGRWQGGEGVGK